MSLRLEMGDPLLGPAGQIAIEMLKELKGQRGVVERNYPTMRVTLIDDGYQRAVLLASENGLPIPEYGLEVWAAAFGQPDAVWHMGYARQSASLRWRVTSLLIPLTDKQLARYANLAQLSAGTEMVIQSNAVADMVSEIRQLRAVLMTVQPAPVIVSASAQKKLEVQP